MSLKYFRRRVSGPETYTTNQNYYRDENLVGQKHQQPTQQQLHQQQHNLRHSFINLDTNAKIYHHNTNPNTYELLKTTSCTGECFNPKNSDTYNLIDQDDYIDHELDETASNLDLSASVVAKRRLRKLTSASKHADDRSSLRHGGIYRPPKRHQSNSSTATASATTVLQTSSTTTIGGGGAANNINTQTATATATTTSATTNCSRNNHHNCTCVSN
ncbi:hypothetical protein ACFFRR_009450 [Megaselia abdita]